MSKTPTPEAIQAIMDPAQRDLAIATFAGWIVSLFFLGERLTWKVAITAMVSGCALSYYGVPTITHFVHVDAALIPPLSFVLGMAGMPILGGFLKLLRMWRDNPDGFLARFLPFVKKGNGQ